MAKIEIQLYSVKAQEPQWIVLLVTQDLPIMTSNNQQQYETLQIVKTEVTHLPIAQPNQLPQVDSLTWQQNPPLINHPVSNTAPVAPLSPPIPVLPINKTVANPLLKTRRGRMRADQKSLWTSTLSKKTHLTIKRMWLHSNVEWGPLLPSEEGPAVALTLIRFMKISTCRILTQNFHVYRIC